MNLERLSIYHSKFDKIYKGTIEIKGENGKIELNLMHNQSIKILQIVSELLVESAKEVAEKLTQECIDITPKLKEPNQ